MLVKTEKASFIKKQNLKVEAAIQRNIFPNFITHEYARFYILAEQGQYTGAWFELRDISEVIIKLPILIGFSYLFSLDIHQENNEVQKILKQLLTKSLSLGDWNDFLKMLCENNVIKEHLPDLHMILLSTFNFVKSCNVVNWRNEMIGHGALPFEDSTIFIEDMCKLSEGIDICLENSIEGYSKIRLWEEQELYAGVSDVKICLEKCIFEKLFFFDSFDRKTTKVHWLDYLQGEHRRNVNNWYQQMAEKAFITDYLKVVKKAAARKRWEWQDVMCLQSSNIASRYEDNPPVMRWLEKCMEKEQGIFLLTMDRGMGKTAFVSSINQLTAGVKEKDWYVRAYYCNALKYRIMEDFVTEFNSIFKMGKDSERTLVAYESAQLRWNDGRKELADNLERVLDAERVEHANEKLKLLFIIDGIDEIYSKENQKNIFDFIPHKGELAEGVHILLTSRNGETEELNEYTQNKIAELEKFSLTDTYNFTLRRPSDKKAYVKMLRAYLKKNLKSIDVDRNIFSQEQETEFFEKISEKSNYRFVDYRLYVELLKETIKNKRPISDISSAENGLQEFLHYMKQMMGEKLYKKAGRILLIVSTAYQPLTVGQCIFLEELRTDASVVDVLAVLKMFESFFVYRRTKNAEINNDTIIESANERYRNAVVDEFGDLTDEIVGDWLDFIEAFYQNRFLKNGRYDPKTDYKEFAIIYLHANIYKYVMEQSKNPIYIKRIRDFQFIDAIFQYEKHMAAKEIGVYIKNLDIDMSRSCIQLLRESGQKNSMLFAGACNNYIFHQKDIYQKTWGIKNSNPKAVAEKEELLKCCEEAVECVKHADAPKEEILEIGSKLLSIEGNFLFSQQESNEVVDKLFVKSYNQVKEILEISVEKGCNLYIQAAERVINIWSREGKSEEIEQLYKEVIEKVKWLKEQKEAAEYLVENSRGRVEYGILTREAMFYRKAAAIFGSNNLQPEGESIEQIYDKALLLLEDLRDNRNLVERQLRVIEDYLRIVMNEYGNYKEKRCNYEKAKDLYDKSTTLAEHLLNINNIDMNPYIIKTSFNYIRLAKTSSDANEQRKVKVRMKQNEKWIDQYFPQSKELKEIFKQLSGDIFSGKNE